MNTLNRPDLYFAYAILNNGDAVIVRCLSREDAIDERERMKNHPSVRKVGSTTKRTTIDVVREELTRQQYKVVVIRDKNIVR